MLLNQYLIRSLLSVKSNVSDNNEDSAESAAADQDPVESAAVGDIEQQDHDEVEESEIVQDAQEESNIEEGSGSDPDPETFVQQPETEDQQENVVQDAQKEESGQQEQDAAQSESTAIEDESAAEQDDEEPTTNIKEVIKEIAAASSEEYIQVIDTASESEYYIETDDYRIITILLLAAVLGAIAATAFINAIDRGMT